VTSLEEPRQPDPVLTWRRRKILRFLAAFVEQQGYPPSLREIGEAVGLAPSSVSRQLSILRKHGHVSGGAGRPRSAVAQPRSRPGVVPGPDAAEVPLVGRIAAGVPVLAEEMIEDTFWLPKTLVGNGTLFMLTVAGDSMVGAGIYDGDLIVVRQQSVAENGETVAAVMTDGSEDEATVKTFQRADGHVWLMPQNPRYAPILGDHAIILDKVVTVLHRA
jgi:repressor LexA